VPSGGGSATKARDGDRDVSAVHSGNIAAIAKACATEKCAIDL
jgi:hypothetical protein